MSNNAKKIGLWNIAGLGVGGAVGSGIFVTLGSAIERTGRSILPITIICVFYMLLAYWYNLAMSGIFVIDGGDYSMKGMLLPPILTGMSVGNAISMLMIPTMLINVYLNVACMIIPKKYPEQFARRSIKAPEWLFNLCSILGGFCAAIVAITLFKDLTVSDAIVAAAVIIVPIIFSAIALKTGSVDASKLEEKRQEIIDAALKADK